MTYKNSILLGTIGGYRDRFHQYQIDRSFKERLKIAKTIPRTDGVEPVYPQDLGHDRSGTQLLKDSGLVVSAVNVNVKGENKFRDGSFTNPDPTVRQDAIRYVKAVMDLASELGSVPSSRPVPTDQTSR